MALKYFDTSANVIPMTYTSKLDNGQQLEIENEGDTTHIAFSSRSSGQQQSQSRGFTTGKWKNPPTLFQKEGQLILQVETEQGRHFWGIRENNVTQLSDQTDVASAEKLPLTEGSGTPKMKPMEPMKPMAPMKPMEPMKPMAPMKPMS